VDDLVFDLAFHLLQLFESHAGIDVDGEKYFAQCLFSREPSQPPSYVASAARTVLHGGVDNRLINAAFDECAPISLVCNGKFATSNPSTARANAGNQQ
jgi:hypothetical protein